MCGLSFFDAEGTRFHLPAYLICALREDDDWVTFHLTHLDAHGRSCFSALPPIQRQVVREFLLFVREDEDHQFDRLKIDKALETFWTADSQSEPNAHSGPRD
jgi:hypothetical protein